jgi:hypothetical protein
MINPFSTLEPVYLIYFFCGAAFLFLSFSIGMKNMKGSNLRIADSLWLLTMFGFWHGIREWIFTRGSKTEFLPVNINEVIANALTLMEHKLNRVVLERDLGPVPEVRGGRGKLEQVFINVQSNALEAMPEGGRFSTTTLLHEGMIEARSADTGTGIAKENISRVSIRR